MGATRPVPFRLERLLTLPELQQHKPQEGFSRLPRRTLLYSCPHSIPRCRGWRKWSRFRNRKGNHSGFHQSVLSNQLKPPVRWSYRKLILWWALVFLSIGWIVFYVNAVTENSAAVLSPPLTLFTLLSAATFLLLLVLFWRHNQFTYKRRYSQWERSFLCERCGTLTEQEF